MTASVLRQVALACLLAAASAARPAPVLGAAVADTPSRTPPWIVRTAAATSGPVELWSRKTVADPMAWWILADPGIFSEYQAGVQATTCESSTLRSRQSKAGRKAQPHQRREAAAGLPPL